MIELSDEQLEGLKNLGSGLLKKDIEKIEYKFKQYKEDVESSLSIHINRIFNYDNRKVSDFICRLSLSEQFIGNLITNLIIKYMEHNNMKPNELRSLLGGIREWVEEEFQNREE